VEQLASAAVLCVLLLLLNGGVAALATVSTKRLFASAKVGVDDDAADGGEVAAGAKSRSAAGVDGGKTEQHSGWAVVLGADGKEANVATAMM
jgi:hypothetical protein